MIKYRIVQDDSDTYLRDIKDKEMKRTLLTITIALCICLAVGSLCAFAADEQSFTLNSTSISTNDRNSTYIEGAVNKAVGQKIIVRKGLAVIAEKTLPETGKKESFRIKIPARYIGKGGVNVFSVKEVDTKGEYVGSRDRVEISCLEREPQDIKKEKKKYDLTFPGEIEPIKAKATSGEQLMYTSSDPKVASVDESGNIVTNGNGDATITVSQVGNGRYEEAETKIDVSVKAIDAYTVTLHSSAGDKDDTVRQIVKTADTVNLKENPFENGDHEFLGWATSDDGLVEYTDAEEISEMGKTGDNVDLYAVWTGDGARAAVAWAIKIANDDSFNYGTGPACHTAGCYFCGTNQRNKPSGYEKTYVCLTFCEAAYAHGAEDPEILAECQGGRRCMAVNDSNFTRYSCWEKVGYTRDLTVDDLEPGDIICFYSPSGYDNGHMEMYAGNGNIVDSASEGWGSGSIGVRYGTAARDLRSATNHNSNSYVMRYVGPNA